jgi:hypothetical protein
MRNGTSCQYDADAGESRTSTLKKKYNLLDKEARQLRAEAHQLKRLYGYICASTEDEAYKLFKHIRASGNSNPVDALRSFGQDVGLTKEYTESPGSTERSDDTGHQAAAGFSIAVPALPWTVVANDEVVSELLSQYFTYDYLYVFPPIPRHIFVDEMKLGNIVTAVYCSPLLVNAICAQQCVSSRSTDLIV